MKRIFEIIWYRFKLLLSDLLFFPLTKHTVSCEVHGNPGANWWIPKNILKKNDVCYSGGVGEDISFDLALLKKYSVSIFAYDPTPRSIKYIKKTITKKFSTFHFLPYGLWKSNTKQRFYIPKDIKMVSHSIVNLQKTNDYFIAECKTLKSIMKQLGHTKIDLLKIDIEGAEYTVLEKMLLDKIFPKILCIEFDQPTSVFKILSMVKKLFSFQYILVKKDYYNFTFLRT